MNEPEGFILIAPETTEERSLDKLFHCKAAHLWFFLVRLRSVGNIFDNKCVDLFTTQISLCPILPVLYLYLCVDIDIIF